MIKAACRIAMAIWLASFLSATPANAQQRPDWLKSYSWSDVQRLNGQIEYFSKRDKVSRAALATIAKSVGLSGSAASMNRMIEAVDGLSKEAAKLKGDLKLMERQIRAVRDSRVREPALEALARANTAFELGNLDDADREFKQIEALRWAQTEGGVGAWSDAMDAQIGIARLRYRFDEATGLARRKAAQANLQGRQLRQYEWDALISAGQSQERKAWATGALSALRSAEQIYEVELGNFLKAGDDRAKRYDRMLLLGQVKGRVASKVEGSSSMATFEESNDLIHEYMDNTQVTKCNECFNAGLSTLLDNVSVMLYRTQDPRHFKAVEKHLKDSRIFDPSMSYHYRYGMHYALANLYSRIGEIRRRVEDFVLAERHAKASISELGTGKLSEFDAEAVLGSKFVLADIYRIRGSVLKDSIYYQKARDETFALIPEYERLNRPHDVAKLQKRLGAILGGLASRSADCELIHQSGAAIKEAMRLMSPHDEPNEYRGLLQMAETNRKVEPLYCR